MTTKQDNAKTVKFLTKTVDGDGVVFTLGNGQAITAKLSDYNQETVKQLALHGLSQKIGDATANCARDKAYGAAFSAMQSTHENLKQGKWNAGREATGGMLIQDLVAAIAKLKKLEPEAVAEAVREANAEQVKAWLKHPAVEAEMHRIREHRAKANAKQAGELEFSL